MNDDRTKSDKRRKSVFLVNWKYLSASNISIDPIDLIERWIETLQWRRMANYMREFIVGSFKSRVFYDLIF